jgi:nucleotide-binding universal stress UspA family protein
MAIIHRILCPIDFSEFSRQALIYALAIAKNHGATVTALHVVPLSAPPFAPSLEIYVPPPPLLAPAEREGLVRSLAEFVRDQQPGEVPITIDVVEAPTIHGEVVAQAGRLRADLIVMGTHGRGGFQRLMFGSVAEKVLRTASPPVMTVGLSGHITDGTAGQFTRILCGVDFSDCSVTALKYALSLATAAKASLTVMNVLEWMPTGYDPLVGPADLVGFHESVARAAREHLHAVVAGLHQRDVEVEEIVCSGKPHHELLRVAHEQQAQLIVLGIHGKNPLDRMLFGSTAEPIVRRAVCPVLTVRADNAARAAAA